MKKFWIFKGIKIALMAIAAALAFSWFTMLLWNWLIPEIFHGPGITFVQAIGLLVLAKILFRSPRGWGEHCHRHRHHWKEKLEERMKSMTPEERENFRKRMRERCGPRWKNFGEEEQDTQPSS